LKQRCSFRFDSGSRDKVIIPRPWFGSGINSGLGVADLTLSIRSHFLTDESVRESMATVHSV
jgi:hypothetical protein